MNDRMRSALRFVAHQPMVGFAPWIVLSVVDGPGRVVLAAGLACAAGAVISALGLLAGSRPKLLEVTAIVFFGALTAVAAAASPDVRRWLGLWSAELSNAAIAIVAMASVAARRPFTLAYARETTPREYWESPLFLRINYMITGAWSVAFGLIAIVGYIGDGPLHQPDNIWTNWIIQIALIVLALKFTGWYPDHATASGHAAGAAGDAGVAGAAGGADAAGGDAVAAPHKPPVQHLLRPLAVYLVVVGIIVIIVAGSLWWAGVILIVAGVVATRILSRSAPRAASSGTPHHHERVNG